MLTLDRHKGRRPFATWMKRLASLKTSASTPHSPKKSQSRKARQLNGKNNPYPESGYITTRPTAPSTISGRASSFTPASVTSGRVNSFGSYEDSIGSPHAPMRSNKSTAPTLATNPETIHSETGFSRAGTTYTDGIYGGRANSTFSSPRASQESLTTTLTTIQSTAHSAMLPTHPPLATQSPINFSHEYPVSPPASAVPSHLQPSQPGTYMAATANGLLSDDASLLTLASSSKRRRRNSLDTNASVRAIAPSSVWGNSRESLPLSVLSANIDREGSVVGAAASSAFGPVPAGRPSISGLASAERASVYSNRDVGAPALVSERNSYYSTKQAGIDTLSVRSGHLGMGHGRAESINGSITGLDRTADRAAAASPLASPRESEAVPRVKRTSGWRDGDVNVDEESEDEEKDVTVNEEGLVKVDSGKGKGKENVWGKGERDGMGKCRASSDMAS